MKFDKILATYYFKWYRDCKDSVKYYTERGKLDEAAKYANRSTEYFDIINENWLEINSATPFEKTA